MNGCRNGATDLEFWISLEHCVDLEFWILLMSVCQQDCISRRLKFWEVQHNWKILMFGRQKGLSSIRKFEYLETLFFKKFCTKNISSKNWLDHNKIFEKNLEDWFWILFGRQKGCIDLGMWVDKIIRLLWEIDQLFKIWLSEMENYWL